MNGVLALAAAAAHELALFAAVGFLVFGADDLLVDAIWIARTAWRRLTVYSRHPRADARSLAPAREPGRMAVFIPAWDESAVIAAMLAHSLERFGPGDYRIFVGCYPNDPATGAEVMKIAGLDPRVTCVVTPRGIM